MWNDMNDVWMAFIALSRLSLACYNHQWPAKAFSRCPISAWTSNLSNNRALEPLHSFHVSVMFFACRVVTSCPASTVITPDHVMLDLWASAYLHASCTLELLGMLWMWLSNIRQHDICSVHGSGEVSEAWKLASWWMCHFLPFFPESCNANCCSVTSRLMQLRWRILPSLLALD